MTCICEILADMNSEDDVCLFFGEFSKEYRVNNAGEVVYSRQEER